MLGTKAQEAWVMQSAKQDVVHLLDKLPDDSTLEEVLRRHLAGVLPGGDHDHPHGQG